MKKFIEVWQLFGLTVEITQPIKLTGLVLNNFAAFNFFLWLLLYANGHSVNKLTENIVYLRVQH